MIVYISLEKELDKLVTLIRETYPEYKTFVLEGDLGAGKTTFVKYFCQAHHTEDAISSPTFSIVNEYLNGKQERFYHFDLYRINEIEELYDLGFQEYLDTGDFIFIEWAEMAMSFLESHIHIRIDQLSDTQRKFTISEQE